MYICIYVYMCICVYMYIQQILQNNKQKMGGISMTRTRSLQRFFPNFHVQDWQQIPITKLQNQSRFGQYTTMRNKITKQQIDRYHITFYTDKQQRIYQQCFMQRLRQQYLVNAFHYQPLKNPGICSTVRGAVVYIQHIVIRLSDITDIPIDQSLYITKCALYGFQKLYNQSGYFQVMEQHIGIDKQGKVRVWLNADVSKNYPSGFDEDCLQSKDNQKTMVAEIITMIQKNTSLEAGRHQDQQVPISILAFMEKHHNKFPSFRQAQQLIRQYANKYQITIPKHCKSVVQIFQEDYGEDFNLTNNGSSSFGDNLDIGGSPLFQDQRNSQMQRQNNNPINLNMTSSRSKGNNQFGPQVGSSGQRPNSFLRENQNILESKQQSYKQYQPISIYKPNQKSKRMSIADDHGPYVQVIKPDSLGSNQSQRYNLHGSQFNNNQADRQYYQSHHSHQRSQSDKNHRHSQSINGSGYNLSGSQHSNNFQIRIVEDPSQISKVVSPIDIAGLTQLGQDQRSSRIKEQQQIKLRQSNASYSKLSRQSAAKGQQRVTVPKITFNYVNRSQIMNSQRISSVKPINTRSEINSLNQTQRNAIEPNRIDSDRDADMELHNDIEKELKFISASQNEQIVYEPNFKRKSDTFEDGIAEHNQDSIDPQIMRDLLNQFPSFEEDKQNQHI